MAGKKSGVFIDRSCLRIAFAGWNAELSLTSHPWMRCLVNAVRKERIRAYRAMPPAERKKMRDDTRVEAEADVYEKRQLRLSLRYAVYCMLFVLIATQVLSLVRWSWINPLEVLGILLLIAVLGGLWAYVFSNIGGVLVVLLRTGLGLDLGSAARKYRDSIYVITLSYFALMQRNALSEISGIIPFESLRTGPEVENLLVLAMSYLWLKFILERFFDSDVACKAPAAASRFKSSAVPASVFSATLAFLFNTLVPVSLTWALLATFDFSAVDVIAAYLGDVRTAVVDAEIPLVSGLTRLLSEPLPDLPRLPDEG